MINSFSNTNPPTGINTGMVNSAGGDLFFPDREDGVGAMIGFTDRILELTMGLVNAESLSQDNIIMDMMMMNWVNLGQAAQGIRVSIQNENSALPWQLLITFSQEIGDKYLSITPQKLWENNQILPELSKGLHLLWQNLKMNPEHAGSTDK